MNGLWLHGFPTPGVTAGWAARAEALGYEGVLLADSETLVADPYVELALAAAATSRIGLGVAVTNPISRHPAVTAAAIATVQAESAGRAVLGFGRGDSALRRIGLHPAGVAEFESALRDLQRYLGGDSGSSVEPLAWLSPDASKVPVDVAATGPRTIAVGALLADRVTFNLGADVSRLRWAARQVHDARSAAGLDPHAISLGAYVDVAVAADHETALRMVRGSASIFAALLAEGARAGVPHIAAEDASVLQAVAAGYDEARHGGSSAPQATMLPDGFLERFAVCGPIDAVETRMRELRSVGLQRIVAVPASRDVDPHEVTATVEALATLNG